MYAVCVMCAVTGRYIQWVLQSLDHIVVHSISTSRGVCTIHSFLRQFGCSGLRSECCRPRVILMVFLRYGQLESDCKTIATIIAARNIPCAIVVAIVFGFSQFRLLLHRQSVSIVGFALHHTRVSSNCGMAHLNCFILIKLHKLLFKN